MAAPNSETISAGATGVSQHAAEVHHLQRGGAIGPVKSILARKPSSHGKLWLEDGELLLVHVAGKRASAMGVPAVGKLLERVQPATHIELPAPKATAAAVSASLPLK